MVTGMFLRYFDGAKPGKRHQEPQKPAADVSQAKKAYEQKREHVLFAVMAAILFLAGV
jgi:hypothetical protein